MTDGVVARHAGRASSEEEVFTLAKSNVELRAHTTMTPPTQQPLLRPASDASVRTPPPQHVFQQLGWTRHDRSWDDPGHSDRDYADHNDDDAPLGDTAVSQGGHDGQVHHHGRLDDSLLSSANDGCGRFAIHLVQSVVVGALCGVMSVPLLATMRRPTWFEESSWHWVWITSLGGFLYGLLMLVSGSRIGTTPSVAQYCQSSSHSRRSVGELLAETLSCVAVLLTGAPLGPETLLTAVGMGLRPHASLVRPTMSAMLALLVPNPLLAPLLLTELDMALQTTVAQQTDWMKSLTLQLVASITSVSVARGIQPSAHVWSGWDFITTSNVESWEPLVWSVPLGLLCGCVGTLVVSLVWVMRLLSSSLLRRLQANNTTYSVTSLLIPTLGGLLLGLLAMLSPQVLTKGWSSCRNAWNEQLVGFSSSETTSALLLMLVTRTAGMAVTLGWGMFPGGLVLPMVPFGLRLGTLVTRIFEVHEAFIPFILATCMAACVVAICPTPFTVTLSMALGLGVTTNHLLTPLLVSCLAAWFVTGGTGVLRRIVDAFDRRATEEDDDDDDETMSTRSARTAELLQNVRSIIFGDYDA